MKLVFFACASTAVIALGAPAWAQAEPAEPYFGKIEVIPSEDDAPRDTVTGVVFEDLNRDSIRQADEPGLANVIVSNGRDVALTDAQGAYALPARADMSVMVTKPSGYQTPVNADWIPQFAYEHKPAGSPELRFGGLAPTGPLPAAINFPLVKSGDETDYRCAVIGDVQTYSNTEVSYFRDGLVKDLVDVGVGAYKCMIYVGDVAGDDLGLLPRLINVASAVQAPQYLGYGNHDIDYDAETDADSADTWRNYFGPNYYSFIIGDVAYFALDNIVYPCGEIDAANGRDFCTEQKTYNGRVDAVQMQWLRESLALVPEDKRIVVFHHVPFVSFVDATSTKHQTDNVTEIYALLEGRPALSLSGHTHTIEQHLQGEVYNGWEEAVGVAALPFHHIVAGAASGAWWQGDLTLNGVPHALTRQGAPRGYVELVFDGVDYTDTYYGAGLGRDRTMWVSFSTPAFRGWFDTLMAWRAEDAETRDPIPPVNVNDLPDQHMLSPEELRQGVFVMANVWNGSRDSVVEARIDGGAPFTLTRTQEGAGEAPRVGAEYADPFAAVRQLQTARFAFQSRSGNPRAQGYEAFRGRQFGPGAPQPMAAVADRSMHLWRAPLPTDLSEGVHVVAITSTDRHGRTSTENIVFEVRAEKPDPHWRAEFWTEGE
ncbi:MAG: calcineurin-like phosphoesterase C-terminal domain-containing protein [Maricaulaceae bacterium]